MRVSTSFIKFFAAAISGIACLALSGCASSYRSENYYLKDAVTVRLIESENMTAVKNVTQIKKGENATFIIAFSDGYYFDSCSYENYTLREKMNGYYELTLLEVKYSCRVSVENMCVRAQIEYNSNGGSALFGEDKSVTLRYDLANHLRPNTSIGIDLFEREGYVLIGWNTAADGKGEHISLGSRVTVPDGETLILYAEWKKCSPDYLFTYKESENGITLTGYKGAGGELVVPQAIGGKSVTAIAGGFAENLKFYSLVLPHGIEAIDSSAFVGCEVYNIYFSDDLVGVSDDSFLNSSVHYWHINAAVKPRYIAVSDNAQFADKMDRLMLNADKKKLIFFAGCSMSYGLKSEAVDLAYGDEYFIINMGVVGGTNAQFQFNCIAPYVGEGDIFVHAPEQGSPYQMMYSTECESRVFTAVEGNYDLLSYTDMTEMSGNAFTAFGEYNTNRTMMDECDYSSYRDTYNEYGDYIGLREFTGIDEKLSEDYCIRNEYVTASSAALLCDEYDKISSRGARVFISYAPINVRALSEEYVAAEEWKDFSSRLAFYLGARGYSVISDIEDYILNGKYFYDTDYHLNDTGAALRTNMLIDDLKRVL